MLNLIQIALGGMVAEELFFSDVSTGPGGDLLTATTVAAQMVGVCGMDDSLVSFQAVQGAALSDTNIVGRVLGDAQGRAAVERLLHEQKERVHDVLGHNRHLVAALRDALEEPARAHRHRRSPRSSRTRPATRGRRDEALGPSGRARTPSGRRR